MLKGSDDVISMVGNLKFINTILQSMTEMLHRRIQAYNRFDKSFYYDCENIHEMVKKNNEEELWTECNEVSKFRIHS